jgi:hypothetical protein
MNRYWRWAEEKARQSIDDSFSGPTQDLGMVKQPWDFIPIPQDDIFAVIGTRPMALLKRKPRLP